MDSRVPSLRPPTSAPPPIDFEIHGDDMQMVEIELDPGETVIAEAGWNVFHGGRDPV